VLAAWLAAAWALRRLAQSFAGSRAVRALENVLQIKIDCAFR